MSKTILSETITEDSIEYIISIKKPLEKNFFIELSAKNLVRNQISKIIFHPIVEDEIIDTLTYFLQEIRTIRNIKYHKLTKDKEKEICSRYLKGVDIVDLKLQFRLDEKIIKEVLQKHNIEIVNQSLPKSGWKAKKWRPRRRNG